MNREQLITFFSSNPAAKLFRSTNAAYILDFLHTNFKVQEKISIPHTELQHALTFYLEDLHLSEPEILRDTADTYLNQWASSESLWLRRYYDKLHAESVYQLSSHTEEVLKFLTEMMNRQSGFIGTESRLARIISTLSEIVIRGSDNRERRLEHLRKERDRINAEIQSLESGEAVATHSPTAIRERFSDVLMDLNSLQGDFRAVEETFKEITLEVQKQQTRAFDSRGVILGYALESEDRLKEGDQGISFDAFVHLLLSQNQQDEFEKLITQLDEMSELVQQEEGKERLRGMIHHLSREADKVMQTLRRLNTTLRRLLSTRVSKSRQRIANVINEIMETAQQMADDPPEVGLELFVDLDLSNAMQRTFWQGPVEFEQMELSQDDPDEAERQLAFFNLAAMQRLDWETMRKNIDGIAEFTDRTPLSDLIDHCGLQNGSIEVLGYIQLAHDDGHEVDEQQKEAIRIPTREGFQEFDVPRVVFLSKKYRQMKQLLGSGEDF
ncbi:MAG: DUF3375 family protein [Planctomycetaceae bacterium]|nr:DUF3375 family protein [Planctomycetaceae bacterium]